jgi:hypothetical protein
MASYLPKKIPPSWGKRASCDVTQESKTFFFEKKNQKTFAPLREHVKRREAQMNKVFRLSFCSQKDVLPYFFFWFFSVRLGRLRRKPPRPATARRQKNSCPPKRAQSSREVKQKQKTMFGKKSRRINHINVTNPFYPPNIFLPPIPLYDKSTLALR